MNVSDMKYLSKFAMDPALEYEHDDLYGFEFTFDGQADSLDNENLLESDDLLEDDEFLFEN